MTNEEVTALIDSKVNQLSEHFDAVQILVSWPSAGNGGGTMSCYRGSGNYFARTGMARDFMNRDEAETLVTEEKRQREQE